MKRAFAFIFAVCLLLSASACGAKPASDDLHVRFDVLYPTEYLTEFLSAPEGYAEQMEAFGVESFEETFKDTKNFKSYNVEVSASNDTDSAVTLLALKQNPKKNGKDGVWFSTFGDDTTYGMPAHFTGKQTMYYAVIADASLSMEEVLEILGNMGIRCIYTNAGSGDETLEEVPEENRLEGVVLYQK